MAKKSAEPVYVEASLTISREEFQSRLEAQIIKGEELLGINVPIVNQVARGYGGYYGVSRVEDHIEYDETAKNKFIADFNRWHNLNVEIYKSSFDAPNSTYRHDYESNVWSHWGSDIIKEYKGDIERLINQMRGDIEKLPLIKCAVESSVIPIAKEETLSNRIFIVHGHDGELKEKVARTLTLLGLEPIILHEQADEGRTIIEKFEDNAEDCKYAVILLTADDLGQSNEEKTRGDDPKSRARQNVVFEMGYFMGRFTRRRVFVLLDNGVDKPGDLDGLVYVSTDDEYGWKFRLVKELNNCGYGVDANKIL